MTDAVTETVGSHTVKCASLITETNTHTHTHNHFMALLDSVQDYLGEPAPER